MEWLRRVGRRTWARRWIVGPLRNRLRYGIVLRGPGRGLRLRIQGGNLGYLLGASEPGVQAAVAALGAEDVFIDIGANIGYFSLLAARAGAEVVAFEPHPVAAAMVRRNAATNRLEITVREVALGARPGRAMLETSHHLTAKIGKSGQTEVQVAALDDSEVVAPTLIKIDVEGYEGEVLRGMAETLRKHRPRVICEIHGETGRDCAEQLGRLGYEVELVDDGGMPHLFARWRKTA